MYVCVFYQIGVVVCEIIIVIDGFQDFWVYIGWVFGQSDCNDDRIYDEGFYIVGFEKEK